MQLLPLLIAALCGFTGLPTGLATTTAITQKANDDHRCSAISFFDKKQAYTSGIVFKKGNKSHQPCYGHFWNEVEVDTTKNIGLKNHEFGHSNELKGYQWGNITLPGYVGGAQMFLLGMQMAMGSASGLLSSSVEKAMYDGVQGECVEEWDAIEDLPSLTSPSGASMKTGILSVWNSTLLRAVEYSVEEEEEDDGNSTVKRSDIYDWNMENKRQTMDLSSALQSRTDSSDNVDDQKCDSDSEEGETAEEDSKYKTKPEECALYRAPWVESKPVYFYGQCDRCDKKTGFNKDGHGSFQSCSLIYQGKEYKGKTGESEGHHYCAVDYDC